jgi:hypothetical protein
MRASLKALLAAVMVVLLTGSVFAQAVNLLRENRPRTADEIEKEQQIEKDYKAEMKKIPDQKASSDPWGNVRSSDTTAKPTTSARKPKQQP